MTSLLAARRQYLASAHRFHAGAETVRLVTAAHFGLKGTFRQEGPLGPPQRTKSKP